ncbi:Transposase [Nitrosomonas sp. Nm51]|uniref:IS110 family transposase n=1 Tax=Nitrosomonas sp. Nm51 TaxID=133720 RepID=UPI0008CB2228|nr:transposase [Nitrosomonas sp. Nm51]SER73039.1 Transposase [Nitrosomonas sp. Nm51]
MLFCGIDLHSNNSFIVIIDEDDRVVYGKRHANSMVEILEAMVPYQDEISGIAVESIFNWYWLIDGLQEQGYSVHLVNTVAVKQYDGMKHRGDESDAKHLAHLLRLGLLPEGYIMPKDRLQCAIWRESACNWYSNAVRGLLRSNRRCSVILEHAPTATRSNN